MSVSEYVPSATRPLKTEAARSSRARLVLIGLGILLLAGLGWFGFKFLFPSKPHTPPLAPVRTALAMKKDVTVVDTTIGTVVSPDMVQVTAQVTGKLLTAYFQEGQLVHKGDPLFLIDPGAVPGRSRPGAGPACQGSGDARQRPRRSGALSGADGGQRHRQADGRRRKSHGADRRRRGAVADQAAVDNAQDQSGLYPHRLADRRQDRPHPHSARQCDHRGRRHAPGHHHPDPADQALLLPAAEPADPDPEPDGGGQAPGDGPHAGRAGRQGRGNGRFRLQHRGRHHRHHRVARHLPQCRSCGWCRARTSMSASPSARSRAPPWCRATPSISGPDSSYVYVVGKDNHGLVQDRQGAER